MKPVEEWPDGIIDINDIKNCLEISCRDATNLMNRKDFPLLSQGKRSSRKTTKKWLREYIGV